MKYWVLIWLGITVSNCAAIKMVSGGTIQAQDVISSVNTVNNIQRYSEPAAREELEREVRAQLQRWQTQYIRH